MFREITYSTGDNCLISSESFRERKREWREEGGLGGREDAEGKIKLCLITRTADTKLS